MKIFQHLQRGQFHDNYCEDYLQVADLGEKRLLLAVMDGCTMGTDSYFAATLIGKTIRKVARAHFYLEYVSKNSPALKNQLKVILRDVFQELIILKNALQLERSELLSTLLLAIVDTKEKRAEIIVIGDGLIAANGQLIEYDQSNVPDYLGYHLQEDFDTWYEQQEQFLTLENIEDLSLSTDGIFTFAAFDNKNYEEISPKEIITRLLVEQSDLENERMLLKKMSKLEERFGLCPTDDLGIIRLVF